MSSIQTTQELLHADFDDIELAEVKFKKGDPTDYIAGRILDRWNSQDLRLRFRGHEYEVTASESWELVRYQPVTSIEKQLILEQWSEDE